jgi:HEPN domain-containing protein
MPHDPARVADTRAWLQKADGDLRAAEHDQTAHPPLLGDVTFHAQQTAEKAFKAFLTWHDKPFRKTHNLEELGEKRA